jgi:hypothetical protein
MISSGAVPNVMEAIPKAKNAKTFERLCGILRNLASEDSFANQFNESVGMILAGVRPSIKYRTLNLVFFLYSKNLLHDNAKSCQRKGMG